MFKGNEIKGLLGCTVLIVLVSWSKLIFTGNLAVDNNPLGEWQGWTVFLLFAFSLFLYGSLYYKLYKKGEQLDLSHRQVKIWGYIQLLIASLMLPILSNDVFIYMAYGDLSNHGYNVFTQQDIVQYSKWSSYITNWKDAPYSYGPITLWVGKIANWVGGGTIYGVLIAYKIIWAIIGILFLEILSLTVKNISDFIWISLTPVLWLQNIGSVHYDMLGAFFLLISIYFISQQKIVFAFIAIALACTSKIIYIIFIPYIIAHYFLINPTRISLKPILYFTLGVVGFCIIGALNYLPFWNGIETIQTPFVYLNTVEPSKSFSEVGGELTNIAFPHNTTTSVDHEITSLTNSASKKWWWKQWQHAFNLIGIILAITTSVIFIVKTKFRFNKQLLAELYVKLCLIFFFFYSQVFNVWYLIALIPFIPLLGNNERIKRYLLIICIFSNLHMIMLNISRESTLYYLLPPIIFINISLFLWQFKKNFLTVESPIGISA